MTMEATGGEPPAAAPPQSASLESPSLADDIGRGMDPQRDDKSKPKPAPKPGANGKETAAEAKAAALYKIRRGDVEEELPGEELAKRLSDDWEEEITGPGGKPWKGTRAELIQAAQRGLGADVKFREAKAIADRHTAMVEEGKKDVPAYLREHLGIEDPEEWIRAAAAHLHQRDQRILKMIQSQNPQEQYEGLRLQQQMSDSRAAQARKLAESIESRAHERRESERLTEAAKAEAGRVFKEARVPYNSETIAIGQKIWQSHYDATGIKMPNIEVAKAVRRELWKARRAELEGLQDDELPQLFGDKLRERIRTLELQLAKAGRTAAKDAAPAPKPKASDDSKPRPGEDERDWQRRLRGMG